MEVEKQAKMLEIEAANAKTKAKEVALASMMTVVEIMKASAVEKVISGRWHLSKPSSPPASVSAPVLETQVVSPEMERSGLVGTRGFDSAIERPRSLAVRELDGAMERPRSVGLRGLDVAMEKGVEPVRPASHEGRVGEGKIGEVPERPKLKLLPRSKPIESPAPSPTYIEEKQVTTSVPSEFYADLISLEDGPLTLRGVTFLPSRSDCKLKLHALHQVLPVPVIASVMQVEVVHEARQNVMVAKTGVAGADAESRATVERPRLNLKPRSNGVGQSGESAAKERPSLFGGARPREQVLRDRGVDALASDLEITSPVGRGEKRRGDAIQPTRRDENRKVARDVEKQPEQQRPEPETWRKPVEPPKPEVTAPRFGKAATALELAQAFSKSMSDTVPQSRLTSVPSPRVPPKPGARDQVGFSRLTDNGALHSGSSQRKINGY
uniref:Uncharacterized protein n=1 Tax=Aegilops tauschii TaxID=37682 RepID=M8BNA0_AEGTA